MKGATEKGLKPIDGNGAGSRRWSLKEKLLLGLSPREYLAQAVRNPFNWLLGAIFIVGIPVILGRFYYGLGWVTHSSNDTY